jgi:hypothetical protein
MKIEIENLVESSLYGYICKNCNGLFLYLSHAISHLEDSNFECPGKQKTRSTPMSFKKDKLHFEDSEKLLKIMEEITKYHHLYGDLMIANSEGNDKFKEKYRECDAQYDKIKNMIIDFKNN